MIKWIKKKIGRVWIYMENHCMEWARFHEK
jgi:hypothetical protein